MQEAGYYSHVRQIITETGDNLFGENARLTIHTPYNIVKSKEKY